MEKKLIWDFPTRLFHWLLVFALFGQYVTAELIDNAMQWHFYIGYFTLGLIIFRVIWGFVGPDYARFSQFIYGPAAVVSYLQTLFNKDSRAYAGHNPLGGWVVIIMLALVLLQAVSGLFMTDDVFLDGPWRSAAEDATLDTMSFLHNNVFNLLLAVIALHIAAIGFYAVYKKQKLAPAMVHGKKATTQKGITSSRLLIAVLVALFSAGIVYYVVEIAPPEAAEEAFYY